MSSKKKMRDFQRCVRSIKSFSNSQAKISQWDDTRLDWIEIQIRPSGGHYQGGTFNFKLYLEKDYPKCAPRVDCLTPIYHPNIDPTCDDCNVCLSLFDEWDEKFGLEDVIQGLLFLLYNPNVEDPLSPYFDGEPESDNFHENIKESLKGGSLSGETEDFPSNIGAEMFDEEELGRDIELILEKACTMIITEEEETEDEVFEENNNVEVLDESASLSPANVMSRMDSKTDRTESVCAACDADGNGGGSEGQRLSTLLARYIPQTFITTEPDFMVIAFLATLRVFRTHLSVLHRSQWWRGKR